MNTCTQCKKQFESYKASFECDKCDEYGEIERTYDWSFNGPEYVTCDLCHGDKEYEMEETQFCSDDCREQYFYPQTDFI